MTTTGTQNASNALKILWDRLSLWSYNFKTQSHDTFSRMRWEDYIRLVAVLGAYILIIRPVLVKLGARHQMRELERQEARDKNLGSSNVNDQGSQHSANSGTTGTDSAVDPAVRHRQLIRKALLEHEENLRATREEEDDDDQDIDEFLIE
ncbi:hypothetical protein EJ05DRAFT_473057 [Pseudovirgaria hyperparasitica]|uniref:DUF1531-domain-containing protein n=1 Tax=Pseudovirgaria hyperparasitica TaxID=470096 RepID=A0A6A6WK24_9PEZI|nr:uncharacterized protein EJ05DRAFT_473057 [Pseudovirgaria hyperparasitica]KAF2762121.1 hypothetical protein EJ05DRAFT_473057 [Pseudovirgaria hyperparasitica]